MIKRYDVTLHTRRGGSYRLRYFFRKRMLKRMDRLILKYGFAGMSFPESNLME